MERAGPQGVAADIDATALPPDPVDTLLEAHAAVVAEIRLRAAQPDLDGREIVVLAKALTALESAIEIVADHPVGSIRGYGQGIAT